MKIIGAALVLLTAITFAKLNAENPKEFTVVAPLDGSKFQLSENRGKAVILHFLLKTECPYCLRYTHEYAKLASKSPDVVHVFLKPDSTEDIKQWASHLDRTDLKELPKIYRDADAELAKQFKIPDGYRFHGQSVHYPALVALDGEGVEMFRYVGKSNSDRLSSADFTQKFESAMAKADRK